MSEGKMITGIVINREQAHPFRMFSMFSVLPSP
jgi:hypothetical protein